MQQFIRREDLQALHASDSGHTMSGEPRRFIDIGRDPLGGPQQRIAIERSPVFEPIGRLETRIAGNRHINIGTRQQPWDPAQY